MTGRSWWLFAVLLVLGIVLLPLRAVAATIPVLFAYDAAVRLMATTPVEARSSLGPDGRGVPESVYDAGDLMAGNSRVRYTGEDSFLSNDIAMTNAARGYFDANFTRAGVWSGAFYYFDGAVGGRDLSNAHKSSDARGVDHDAKI